MTDDTGDSLAERRWLRCAVAAAAAAATTALASAPVEWTATQWVCLVPLLWALDEQQRWSSFLIGWAAGAGANLALFTWLGLAFRDYGSMHPVPAALAFGVYVAFSGLQYALLGLLDWAARAWWPRARLLLFPCAFVGVELLWPRLFPWHVSTPQAIHPRVIQIAEWGGQLAVTFVLVAWNCGLWALVLWWRGGRTRGSFPRGPVAWACALVVGTLSYGALRLASIRAAMAEADALRVSLVQPNLVLNRTRPHVTPEAVQAALLEGARGARRAGAELALFSEGAAAHPTLEVLPSAPAARGSPLERELKRRAVAAQDELAALAEAAGCPILVGLTHRRVRAESATQFSIPERSNVLLLLGRDGRLLGRYDKHVLLPFAEYLPGERTFPWLRDLLPFAGSIRPGEGPLLLDLEGRTLAPLVCYEGVSPAVVRDTFAERAPHLLVNATNDVWFAGQGPHLHRMIAIWRAVETRRSLVRVTSTGLSVAVFPDGTLHAETRAGAAAVETVDVPLLETRPTPYTRAGELFGWLVVLVASGLVLYQRGRARGRDAGAVAPEDAP